MNQRGPNRYGSMLIQRFDLNRNIVAVSVFFNTAILPKKKLRFDPTLGSNNSGLKNYSILNHHIFGKPWTSAFRWHTLDTSEKFSNLRKKCLLFISFCPFLSSSLKVSSILTLLSDRFNHCIFLFVCSVLTLCHVNMQRFFSREAIFSSKTTTL